MKKYFFFIFLLMGILNYGQKFQGKATYESKTQVNMDFGNREISEQRKKMMMDRMKRANEKTFTLSFNKLESIYIEEEKLEQPGSRGGRRWGAMSGAGGDFYKNIEAQNYVSKNELMGKVFLVQDELIKLDWKLGSASKKIGNYTVYEATATKVLKRPNMRAMFNRGKSNGKEEVFVEEEVKIVAWYTPEIPINQGPHDYFGLPGLILEVNTDNTTIICSKIVMNPKDKLIIKAPSKGKKVTQKEYDKIAKEKMLQARENFRNSRNRRRG